MLRLSQPQQFLATERQTVEKAYPGDIIGIFDTGELGVGDTVCEKKSPVTFIDFPVFPPELFARLSPESSMKRKQFLNGVSQLAQEGAIRKNSSVSTTPWSFMTEENVPSTSSRMHGRPAGWRRETKTSSSSSPRRSVSPGWKEINYEKNKILYTLLIIEKSSSPDFIKTVLFYLPAAI